LEVEPTTVPTSMFSLPALALTFCLERMGTTRLTPGRERSMVRASSQDRVMTRWPTAWVKMSPPRTKAASGPNISVISTALRWAPSTAATMTVSAAMPSAVAQITNRLRSL